MLLEFQVYKKRFTTTDDDLKVVHRFVLIKLKFYQVIDHFIHNFTMENYGKTDSDAEKSTIAF